VFPAKYRKAVFDEQVDEAGSRQVCVYCKIEEERRRQKNVTEKSERNSRG
jgi:hypothetical protein